MLKHRVLFVLVLFLVHMLLAHTSVAGFIQVDLVGTVESGASTFNNVYSELDGKPIVARLVYDTDATPYDLNGYQYMGESLQIFIDGTLYAQNRSDSNSTYTDFSTGTPGMLSYGAYVSTLMTPTVQGTALVNIQGFTHSGSQPPGIADYVPGLTVHLESYGTTGPNYFQVFSDNMTVTSVSPITAVPEPTSIALVSGAIVYGAFRCRRRKRTPNSD